MKTENVEVTTEWSFMAFEEGAAVTVQNPRGYRNLLYAFTDAEEDPVIEPHTMKPEDGINFMSTGEILALRVNKGTKKVVVTR